MTDFTPGPLRLFLGIPLPREISEPFRAFGDSYDHLQGIRWIPYQNLHVTVFFFGNVAAEMVENLISLIHLGIKETDSFPLEFDRYCFAPRPKDPRMIWARYRKTDAFRYLVEDMSELYQQISPKQQNRKSPIPHVTMARMRDFDMSQRIDFGRHLPPRILKVDELVLWKSELRPEGAFYEVVERFGL